MKNKLKGRLSNYQIIALGFLALILIGAAVLSLPVSSASKTPTPFLDSLFTSTSAVCVTGLVVYDTFAHWSLSGKIIILLMIQIGGLGLMTVITLLSVILGKKLSVGELKLASQSAGAMTSGTAVPVVRRVVYGSLIVEAAGTLLLAVRFCPEFGFLKGLGLSAFHAVSAFCNAGFDLMGQYGEFSSMTPFARDYWVNIALMLLITAGGIGVIVWNDILKRGLHLRKYSFHSKIVLAVSACLVIIPFFLFFVLEYSGALAELSLPEKITAAMFLAVSPRTAGFNTVSTAGLGGGGKLLTIVLMLIGGSPGSTAGGMKTTVIGVIAICAFSAIRGTDKAEAFKRRLPDDTVYRAAAVFSIYIIAVLAGAIALCALQDFPVIDCLFEAASAAGTVGLTAGITPSLNAAAKIIVMLLMFAGRIGLLSFAMVIGEKRKKPPLSRPTERIMI